MRSTSAVHEVRSFASELWHLGRSSMRPAVSHAYVEPTSLPGDSILSSQLAY